MDNFKVDVAAKSIGEMSDADLEQLLRELPRLDFDRVRRTANWLTHRRDGK